MIGWFRFTLDLWIGMATAQWTCWSQVATESSSFSVVFANLLPRIADWVCVMLPLQSVHALPGLWEKTAAFAATTTSMRMAFARHAQATMNWQVLAASEAGDTAKFFAGFCCSYFVRPRCCQACPLLGTVTSVIFHLCPSATCQVPAKMMQTPGRNALV